MRTKQHCTAQRFWQKKLEVQAPSLHSLHYPPSQPHFSYPACCLIWHVLETNGLRTTNWRCTMVINKLVEGIEFDHPEEVLSCPVPQNLEVLHRILEPVSTDREGHGAWSPHRHWSMRTLRTRMLHTSPYSVPCNKYRLYIFRTERPHWEDLFTEVLVWNFSPERVKTLSHVIICVIIVYSCVCYTHTKYLRHNAERKECACN